MDVRELDIDLIDRINPFGEAYAILAKTMSEESLKQVAAAIAAKRVSLTMRRRGSLRKRALKFKKERGRLPAITSPDAWEKRMAEGVAALARYRAQAKAAQAQGAWQCLTATTTNFSTSLASRSSRRKKAAARRARSASSPASRRFSASSKSMAAPRSMARIATSSSGSMPCASTACARCRRRASSAGWIRPPWPAGRRCRRHLDVDELDDEPLLAELGVRTSRRIGTTSPCFATSGPARRTRRRGDRQSPEMRGLRQFQAAVRAGRSGSLSWRPPDPALRSRRQIAVGNFFILGGQMAYVAEMGEEFRTPNGETNARLRVIFDNGTESNLLMRSLQRALHQDEAGRRITDPPQGPLFGDVAEADDIESGTIYVLRSLSDHPFVVEHRELIHKIGVTGGEVESRIAAAAKDATYLLADVEVVATYKLYNINRTKLENLFHRIFGAAQLDLTIEIASVNRSIRENGFLCRCT